MKHKHYEYIVAWAEGAEIEEYRPNLDQWIKPEPYPVWDVRFQYRIKPEPKPDIVAFSAVNNFIFQENWSYVSHAKLMQGSSHNLKLTFDGETGQPKSAEIIK